MKDNRKSFDARAFQHPDIDCAPIYSWVWNSVCTREIIDEQLSEMLRLGVRAFYIIPEPKNFRPDSMPTELTPDYLTDEYLALVAYALEAGRACGMYCWLYDEGGWPSGGACGQVLASHPECARTVLQATERVFRAGSVYEKTDENTLAAFLPSGEQITEGYRFDADTAVDEYAVAEQAGSMHPNLLHPKTTEHFIEITHERYASVLGDALGKSVTAVFTDEPNAPTDVFTKELAERYDEAYGESILPHLPLLAGKRPVTADNVSILYRWFDLCSRAFCERFLLPCKAWSNAHGMSFTGHMNAEQYPMGCVRGGNFHLLRALRCLDIPGVDEIWRQIYPVEEASDSVERIGYNGFFPRYASSAAAQNGSGVCVTESFGVHGPGITFDEMRYNVAYQAVRGINLFNPMLISLGRTNAYLAQELPAFAEDQLYYRDLPQFNRYMERLSYTVSLGERVCDTALYYPVHDLWGRMNSESVAAAYESVGRALEARKVDFDIVDDDVITAAEGVADGVIRMGLAAYRHIVIPKGAYLPPETARVLDAFVQGGGTVSHTAADAIPAVTVLGEAKGIRAMRRKTENGELICLFCENGAGSYTVKLDTDVGYRLVLEDGTVHSFKTENGMLTLPLVTGEMAVLYLTDATLCTQAEKQLTKEYFVPDAFRFARTLSMEFGADRIVNVPHGEDAVPLPLGDWAPLVGDAYSGSGRYETVFSLPAEAVGRAGVLDLGDVRYSADVSLNGCPLGTVLMPPYRLDIPAGLLKEENLLVVRVTNTPANQYVHTDFFDKWEKRELSPYFARERELAKTSLAGGLYGPVKVQTE